jgi:hypothetical protein
MMLKLAFSKRHTFSAHMCFNRRSTCLEVDFSGHIRGDDEKP